MGRWAMGDRPGRTDVLEHLITVTGDQADSDVGGKSLSPHHTEDCGRRNQARYEKSINGQPEATSETANYPVFLGCARRHTRMHN